MPKNANANAKAKVKAKAKAKAKTVSDLLVDVRSRMRKVGDSARAIAQQAYMKSAMPYHGLTSAETRGICKSIFEDYDFSNAEQWRRDVLGLWRDAEKREERYAAVHLATLRGRSKAAKTLLTIEAMPMLEEMIVTGAWWDYVDELASHAVAPILKREKKTMRPMMLTWSKCDDIWKRRTSIICQLPFKEETDLGLLYTCIEPSISRNEFWLRKAIGWALRQYAWTDPGEVKQYVAANEDRLSYLSKREALKNIGGYVKKEVAGGKAAAATSSPKRGAKRKSASSGPRTLPRARRARS